MRTSASNSFTPPSPVAVTFTRRFEETVGASADLIYERAYALNRQGEVDDALDAYGEALKLDPDHAAARYDRGELYLAQGEDAAARADLEAAARLRPDHWAAWFRLAQLDARAGDPEGMEAHLIEALRQGFDLGLLVADPHWRAWFQDPRLGPVLTRLVTVYGDEHLLEGR